MSKLQNEQEIREKIKNLKMLFVDDEEFVVEIVQDIFPYLFKECFYACNGKEGLELLQKNDIDIVITDISMPKMCGLTMINSCEKENLKVIYVSGHNEEDQTLPSNSQTTFITKPISSINLFHALNEIL